VASHIAWSHSRLEQFKECPRKLWHSALAPKGSPDRIEFEQTQAMKDGNAVDEALSARISKGTPLPAEFAGWESLCQNILAAPGDKLVQVKIAFDVAMKECGYMDWNKAWLRVIYDLCIVQKRAGFIWDWKNGQIKVSEDQLRLFALTGFHYFPEVEEIHTSYVWLKHGQTSNKVYYRKDVPAMWATFTPDVERLQSCATSNHWPTTPSPLACKWCGANKSGRCKDAAVQYGAHK